MGWVGAFGVWRGQGLGFDARGLCFASLWVKQEDLGTVGHGAFPWSPLFVWFRGFWGVGVCLQPSAAVSGWLGSAPG